MKATLASVNVLVPLASLNAISPAELAEPELFAENELVLGVLPLVPDVPRVPDDPLVPDVPLVPDDPLVPDVPDIASASQRKHAGSGHDE